jgi:hypothetical protein
MPDGSVRKHDADGAYEYVVAVKSAWTGEWSPRGWFVTLESAERVETNLKTFVTPARVALLAVDDPEGDE